MDSNDNIEEDIQESTGEKDATQTENIVKAEKSAGKIGLMRWVMIAVLMFMSSTASIMIYDRYYAQKLVAFDLQEYLTKQRMALQNNQITEKQIGENLDVLKAKLDNMPKNQAVITADVVLRNIQFLNLEK
jgi:hypothetical protein